MWDGEGTFRTSLIKVYVVHTNLLLVKTFIEDQNYGTSLMKSVVRSLSISTLMMAVFSREKCHHIYLTSFSKGSTWNLWPAILGLIPGMPKGWPSKNIFAEEEEGCESSFSVGLS